MMKMMQTKNLEVHSLNTIIKAVKKNNKSSAKWIKLDSGKCTKAKAFRMKAFYFWLVKTAFIPNYLHLQCRSKTVILEKHQWKSKLKECKSCLYSWSSALLQEIIGISVYMKRSLMTQGSKWYFYAFSTFGQGKLLV